MFRRFFRRIRNRKKLLPWFLFCLLTAKIALALLVCVLASRYPLAAQILDICGIPSTVYMGDVACDHCNSFHSTNYLIEPKLEPETHLRLFLLNLVISHYSNAERRQTIRNTWGRVTDHHGHQIRTYFIVGLNSAASSNVINGDESLQKEATSYRDIVQIKLDEDYHHLTNKSIAALHWATSRLPNARFLMKTDDDCFNAVHRFVDYLVNVNPNNFVGGMCSSGEQPHRLPTHRWYVSKEDYPSAVYPLHAHGRAYVLSQDAARRIVSVSANVRFNSMEDIYVTGVCRATAGLACTHIPGIPNRDEISDCDVALFVFNVPNLKRDAMFRFWSISRNATARELCSDV